MGSRRIRMLVVSLAVAGTAWGTAAQAVVAPQWNHDPSDAVRGPLSWAQIDATFESCGTGTSQSPVDVGTSSSADRHPR
jgi:carbonic anhydrase